MSNFYIFMSPVTVVYLIVFVFLLAVLGPILAFVLIACFAVADLALGIKLNRY
jgi:hypothetical protein